MHCLLARFCFTYVLCVTLSRGLQIDEAAAAATSLEAWASAPARERDASMGLLAMAVEPAAPSPPIWERLHALPDPLGEPRATSTPKKGTPKKGTTVTTPRRWRRLLRREWKPLERVSV